MKKIITTFSMCAASAAVAFAAQVTVNVENAGTLAETLTVPTAEIEHLSISGNINGNDFCTIRNMWETLKTLDLKDVKIVKGGEYENPDDTYGAVWTDEDDVFPKEGLMFMTNLQTVTLPTSITKIDGYAFYHCSSLESIEIPDNVAEITFSVFDSCSALKTVKFGNGIKYTGVGCFSLCSQLENVEMGENVEYIGSMTFQGCSALKTVVFGDKVKEIRGQAFAGCSSLQNVALPASLESILSSAFSNCKALRSITLPDACTILGAKAFFGCTDLESVQFGTGIDELQDNVFQQCPSVKSIYCTASMPVTEMGENVFGDIDRTTCTLYVPVGSKNIYSVADQWKAFTHIVESNISTGITDVVALPAQTVVYDLDGNRIAAFESETPALPGGIYVFKTGGNIRKVIIK